MEKIIEEKLKIVSPYGIIDGTLTPCLKNDSDAPILILVHGFRGSMEGGGRAVILAEMAAEYCNVIRFNFNGSQILSKQIEELEKVIIYVRQRFGNNKIFLLGRSMGGAAALTVTSQRNDIQGLILWATPNDLQITFKNALGSENYKALLAGESLLLNDERGELILTPEFLTDIAKYNLQSIISGWKKCPLLILHGEKDETVSVEQARENFSLAGTPKKLVIINGGDHSFTNHGNKAATEVVEWLKSRLMC